MGYVRKTEKVGQCDGKMGCCLRSTKLTFARNADKIAAEADGNHSRGGCSYLQAIILCTFRSHLENPNSKLRQRLYTFTIKTKSQRAGEN